MKIEKLLIFAPLLLFVRGQTACFREIDEDICGQREGFDTNCDARCTKLHALKTRAECRARQTGTLLSFFGIRSFICTCHLNPIACTNPQLAQQPYHQQMVQQHSALTPIHQGQICGKPCNDTGSFIPCGWQVSRDFEWFGATPIGGQVLSSASPRGDYLVGKGVNGGILSTCDGLCAKSSVNLTARVWRSPGVLVELCFKENDAIMCAPVHSTNGALINEIIPETEHFQVLFKFSNLTTDEMVLIDDVAINYKQCQAKLHIAQISGESATKSISTAANTARMCVGRAGLAYCRQKCRALEAAESSARCLRQKENPLMKKCVCQVRRSPQRVDGPSGVIDNKIHDEEVIRPESTPAPKIDTSEVEKQTCTESNCSFEKDTDCDWADLRMLSRHFNNISVAMKKGDENRYGISRLRPKSYSGLLHKTSLTGPISMSIDIFPSHIIDVRICVQNLRKCQTQTISARSWNRVSARIKVNTTEKVFVLFYNSADETKSIAIDNILIKSGQDCG